MLILVGYVIVIGSVLGGYAMVGGHMGALYQPAELVIIFGAGIGAFVAANNGKGIGATVRVLPKLLRGSQYSKEICVDLMTLLYLLLAKARQSGMMSLEQDIENPRESTLFSAYPKLVEDKLIMDFRRETFALDALIEAFGELWMPEDFFNPYRYRMSVFELYDLREDPGERRNLASQEPEIVAELSEALWAWMDAALYEGRHHESQQAGIDPGIQEALRALGYTE